MMQIFRRRTGVATVSGPGAHRHQWVRVPGSLGRFQCRLCPCSAVCVGCLGGVPAGFTVERHWCARHR